MAIPHLSPDTPGTDASPAVAADAADVAFARATALAEHSTDIIAISTLDDGVSWVSPSVERVLGYAPDRVLGRCPSEIVHADDLAPLIASFQTVIADPAVSQPVEVRALHADGTYVWFECTINNRLDDPVVSGLVLSLHNIDARRRSEERLRASELRTRAILETAADAIITIDEQGTIQTFNGAAERIFGASAEAVIGRGYRDFIPTAWAARLISDLREGVDLATEPVETIVRRATGEEFPARISLSKVDVDGHIFYTAILRDITRQKVTERALEQMARYDDLTGLPNRHLLIDRIEDAIRRARRHGGVVGVMFLDLDRFKLVNDSLGHDVGDSLLTLVAYRLRTIVREEDTVARLGGDEFVVLCNGLADVGALTDVAVRLADVLRAPFSVGNDEVFVTASIGISIWDGGDETALELLRYADTAMYRAKEHGRARFELFDERMQSLVMARLDVESALRYALQRDELRAYYQPIVELGDGRPTHLEALARWDRPNTGIVSPNDFIHIAEDTGLIVPIGEWMLRQAMTDCVRWQDIAPGVGVAVNVSGRQLNTGNFRDVVASALLESGLTPGLLTLEITESVLLEDAERTLHVLEELRALGIRIALDDFGTGFSSLTYLHTLPIDELKIDQSFVRSLEAKVTENTLLQMIIHLGSAFGLRVVAEGVDSELKLHVLQQLGCCFGQGFLFAQPQPLDTVLSALEAANGNGEPRARPGDLYAPVTSSS
jgi:diguanylate cyclase (GGDEF)-like protein/PAS domain S-box-containing protein